MHFTAEFLRKQGGGAPKDDGGLFGEDLAEIGRSIDASLGVLHSPCCRGKSAVVLVLLTVLRAACAGMVKEASETLHLVELTPAAALCHYCMRIS